MSDKKQVIPGIDTEDVPELVQGARFSSASELDNIIEEIFGSPETVDIRPRSPHIKE